MASFPNTVSPPGGMSYAAPLLNFAQFSNWAADDPYQKVFNEQQKQLNDARVQQAQRQQELMRAFPQGLPRDAQGNFDPRAAADLFAKFGAPDAAVNLMQQQPPPMSPMFGGQGSQGAAADPSAAATASKIVQVESGGDPEARNPNSSATGLGQFTDATWLDAIKRYFPNLAAGRSEAQLLDMRRIPQLARRVTEAFTAGNQEGLTKAGLPVTPATSYLAHFAGLGGAIKVLRADPDTPVNQILGNAAVKANPFLKGMTARDLTAWAARKMQGPAMVAQQQQDQPAQGGGGLTRLADASPVLPPSVNLGTPALALADPRAQGGMVQPQPQQGAPQAPQMAVPPGAQQGAPNGAASPAPLPASPQVPQQPIVPQVPLPRGFNDPQQAILALRSEAARYASMPNGHGQARELDNWAQRIEASIQPVKMGQYDTYLDPRTGQQIYQGPGAAALRALETASSSPTLDADAERYRQTGQLPPNMGRGLQGNAEARAIRQRATDIELSQGGDPATWPGRWQDFRASGVGKSAGERVRANREENLNLILKAADAAIPAALEASRALPRSDFVPLNKLIQKGEIMTSNPRLVAFGMANLQLAEHWARAMNPTGVMRESDRDKALSFLSTAYGNNTYDSAVMQLQKQITRERDAIRGGSTILKDGKAPDPAKDLSAAPDKDGWVNLPNGARIQEVK